jgi:hypothetical protein
MGNWDVYRADGKRWFTRKFIDIDSHNYGTGACAMEWVAAIVGECHDDHPSCVCPVLTEYVIVLNDSCSSRQRQELRPLLVRMINTRGDGKAGERKTALSQDHMRYRGGGYTAAEFKAILKTLDEMLPETVELSPEIAERALDFCQRNPG